MCSRHVYQLVELYVGRCGAKKLERGWNKKRHAAAQAVGLVTVVQTVPELGIACLIAHRVTRTQLESIE